MGRKIVWCALCLFVSLAVASCDGSNSNGGDGGMIGDGGSSSDGGGIENGNNCTSGSQCQSGYCSDGVCCSSACDQPCDACSVQKGATLNGICGIVGAASPGDPSCAPYFCTGNSAECPTRCDNNAECGEGTFCVDNRCCDTECTGLCSSCSIAGSEGICTPYEFGEDPEGECGDVGCNGMGACICDDTGPGEPNETETQAYILSKIDDCDGSGSSVSGVLTGASDRDWYRFEGEDGWTCSAGAVVSLSSDVVSTVCVYLKCTEGNTEVECESGSDSTSPEGLKGCCSSSKVEVTPDCDGWDENIYAYISVESSESICTPYTVTYNY